MTTATIACAILALVFIVGSFYIMYLRSQLDEVTAQLWQARSVIADLIEGEE